MSGVDRTPDVIAAVALGVQLATFVITVVKGRKGWAILGFVVPVLWIVMATRLARPESPWADRFYDERKRSAARTRFAPRRRSHGTPTPASGDP